jgi:hypothetical protein
MRGKGRSAEQEVARIARRQHGVVTRRQLLVAGFGRHAVDRRAGKGTLHRVYRGVYRVGHKAPSTEARYMAAVLACGEGAALSGVAAAFLYEIQRGSAPAPEVSTLLDRRIRGVITHRVRHLDPRDSTRCCGIPITTLARTVVDLAARLELDPLGEACHEAQVRRRLTAEDVYAALARKPNAPGAWKLREIFSGQARITLSMLERAFLALLRSAGLPLPQTNRLAGGRYVDCAGPGSV